MFREPLNGGISPEMNVNKLNWIESNLNCYVIDKSLDNATKN